MADKQIDKYLPKLRFPEFKDEGEWQVVRLGDVVRCFSGGTPSATNKDYYGGDIPFIRSGELHSSKTELYLTRAGLENSSAKMVEKGTILYALYGATSGDVGIARVSGAINQAILAIIPNANIDKMYLYQYLSYSKDFIINRFLQGGQGNLSASIITSLSIPLPTIQEQKIISSCLSSLDECIALSKKKLEQLKAHKSGLMQKLFPAPGKSLPEYRFPEFQYADNWQTQTLGELGDCYSGLSGKSKDDFGHGKAEYITYLNVFNNSIVNSAFNQPIEEDPKQHQVRFGDIFFTISSETPDEVGMSSVWIENRKNVYLNSFCFGYRVRQLSNLFDIVYLSYFFRSDTFRKKITVLAQGIARYNISKNRVMELSIQYPSIQEQKIIAGCLHSLDEIIRSYSINISSLREQQKGLLQRMIPRL